MNNYQEIIENLSVEKVKELLYRLGAENIIEKPDCLITNTICHNEEGGSMKLYYYFDNHFFYCYTNCAGMSIFSFLKHYYETRDITYDWYEDVYSVVLDCSNFRKSFGAPRYKKIRDRYEAARQVSLPTFSPNVLECFTKLYPLEWIKEGITKETMDKFNILYSIPQNKIIIPHYNVNGELVGIRGRALDEWEIENVGKYMPVKVENTWYNHPLSLNLYGLNITKENIEKEQICFLFEGEKSVLISDGFQRKNCAAAVCGSQFNKHALKILIQNCHPQEIVICFDKEDNTNDKYFNKLYAIGKKYQNYADFSFIFDKDNLLEMKDSPVDKGEKVFNKLLERRVKIR